MLLVALAINASEPAFVVNWRNTAFDAYQHWHPRANEPAPVRVIAIDDASLERVGQWPWPRTRLASLVNRLRDAGAAVVALDMVFAEPDRTSPAQVVPLWREAGFLPPGWETLPDHDALFANALRGDDVVIGFILPPPSQREPGDPAHEVDGAAARPNLSSLNSAAAVPLIPQIAAAAAGVGALNVPLDRDGILRRMPLLVPFGTELYPSFAAEALRVYQRLDRDAYRLAPAIAGQRVEHVAGVDIGAFHVPTDKRTSMRLYETDSQASSSIAAWRVLEGDLAGGTLEGHIALVGLSATGIEDENVTARQVPAPGVRLHAQLLEQIFVGVYLDRPRWALTVELFFIAAVSVVVIAVGRRAGAGWTAAIVIAAATFLALASWLAFVEARLLIDPMTPTVFVLSVFLAFSLLSHMRSEHERRWIRRAFASYVSPKLVDELLAHPAQLRLGGERRELTFLFTDLAGFTSLVETLQPAAVLPLLNRYLDGIVGIVFRHDGTVDKIVGDAVHVIFGAPAARPDHAAQAIACALEIDAFATRFADERTNAGVPFGETRIGINTGAATVGNFGGALRFDYTAHGDAVNTAARLESANRHLGTRICISEHTVRRCDTFVGRPIGTLILKGKTQEVSVYEPLAEDGAQAPATAAYCRAYALLRAGDPAAADAFRAVLALDPGDRLAAFHLARVNSGDIGTIIRMLEK